MNTLVFKNRTQATKQTKISYLGKVDVSSKLIKNSKISKVNTYCIYLSPANLSGYNTCSHSTPECRIGCLNTSGRAGIEMIIGKDMISSCRIKRTKLLFEQPSFFMQWIIEEIKSKKQLSKKKNMDFAVRMNGTSDIDWSNILVNGKNIFEIFPDIQFYDYTKNPNKFNKINKNHHLTFSYTGKNWQTCEMLLQKGFNVAVVFDVKTNHKLPTKFNGYRVTDGDLTDYRPLDPKGTIVGLRWKKIGNKEANDYIEESCFVVKPQKLNNGLITFNVKQTKTVKDYIQV